MNLNKQTTPSQMHYYQCKNRNNKKNQGTMYPPEITNPPLMTFIENDTEELSDNSKEWL